MSTVTGYKFMIGSDGVKTSKAEENIIPATPEDWTYRNYSFYEFQIMNYEDCHISVNDGEYFFLKANRGIYTTVNDPKVVSVKFKEGSITYEWIGKFGQ